MSTSSQTAPVTSPDVRAFAATGGESPSAKKTAASEHDPQKRRLALASLGLAIGCYAFWNVVLVALSWHAERHLGSIPFRNEDWMRYLLRGYMGQCDRDSIFITGSSAARENLLVYKFEEAYHGTEVVLGACSVGTLEDTILGLEYIERVYGPEHIPGTIVLGITSRTVGCFNNNHSPFQKWALNAYSPYCKVERIGDQRVLVDKKPWERARAAWKFLFKQPSRFKNAIVAVGARVVLGEPNTKELFDYIHESTQFRQLVAKLGLAKSLRLWTHLYVMPYKYHHQPPRTQATLDYWLYVDDSSYWHRAREWDASQDQGQVQALFQRFFHIASRHDCRVFIVNMPEHPQALREYHDDRYQKYLDVVREAIGDTPFLDVHDQFAADQFHDFIHLKAPGAKRLSDIVLEFMAKQPSAIGNRVTIRPVPRNRSC